MAWTRFHPLTRILIAVAFVLVLASLAGWERVGNAVAHFSPAGSFENRCAELPANQVDVDLQPLAVVEDTGQPFTALARLTRELSTTHRTIGVTHANFGHRSLVEVKGIEERRQARACVRPRVKIELFVKPVTVYIASEYAADPCQARVIREHEQQHVEVLATFAQEAAGQLQADLTQVLGTAPHFAMSLEDAQRSIDRQIGDTLTAFMRNAERTLAERHARVDTPAEYARVSSACIAG